MYKLTLKKAEGYIKSRKVIISLEYHAEHHWWVRYSWIASTPKFFNWFYFADRYFNRVVKEHGLDVTWHEDKDEVADIIAFATTKRNKK